MDLPNIVIVAIDSLRADHLGCYGYKQATSPCIGKLARDSVVFDTAIAAGIPTMPSFTTLYTGLHPYRHGIVAHSGHWRLSERIKTLPQLAKERGYVTMACDNLVIQGEGRGSWFARGYDHYSGFLYQPFGDQSARLTERAIGLLDACAEQPLFLFMHYWDPHSPYGPLPPYDSMHYMPGSGAFDMADVRRIHPDYYDAFLGSMRLRHPEDYAYVVAQYDGEINQVDTQVGRLIEALQVRGRWDNTIFVLMSDHGECFGEGGLHFDHHGLYDAVTRIALMLRVPSQKPGRIRALVSTEDILPTLGALVGLPEPPLGTTGVSMLPLLQAETNSVRPFVVSSESSRQASLALRTDRWKLILPIVADAEGQPLPDFYGRPRNPTPLLFDLEADPNEQHDLSSMRPDKLNDLLAQLNLWRTEMAHTTRLPDPIQAHGLSLRYDRFMERLFGRKAG